MTVSRTPQNPPHGRSDDLPNPANGEGSGRRQPFGVNWSFAGPILGTLALWILGIIGFTGLILKLLR